MDILESYKIEHGKIQAPVSIIKDSNDFVLQYKVEMPQLDISSVVLIEELRHRLISDVKVKIEEIIDPKSYFQIKERYEEAADKILEKECPDMPPITREVMKSYLVSSMVGIGQFDVLLSDQNLEEIALNEANQPAWVYHKKFGWLKTNIMPKSENETQNYAAIIGRRIGREITNLHPLMDARLPTGDRVNATIFPVSTQGNTLTIRKFARKPWTTTDFLSPEVNTLNFEVASLLWLAIQYELNILIAGGTGSGKTSMLNALTPFIPPNQRVVSIEDTRELKLPEFLHWIPLATRSPNPEGKGGVSMLDLMVNSLRMRPDRIMVGEVRRGAEAEVLFEAMHTGHSVYSTIHADTVEQTYKRLVNPPINVPATMLESLHLILVQFRQRRLNLRRTFEVAEIKFTEEKNPINLIYKWVARDDKLVPVNPSNRVYNELEARAGMDPKDIKKDLKNKQEILKWMYKNKINDITDFGKIVSSYYMDESSVLDLVKKGGNSKKILGK